VDEVVVEDAVDDLDDLDDPRRSPEGVIECGARRQ
jgi:hypothetical protein